MYARYGAHPEKKIDDLIGTVAHEHAPRIHPVKGGERLHQTRIARLRITEGLPYVLFQNLPHPGRNAQRILVAGHFDDSGKPVTPGYFGNAEAGFVGFEGRHLGADVVERGKGEIHGYTLKKGKDNKKGFPPPDEAAKGKPCSRSDEALIL